MVAPVHHRSRWEQVMDRVPRERFIPDVIYRLDPGTGGNDYVPVDRRRDPVEWARLVAADAAVITQVDDGQVDAQGAGFEPTSSASQPELVADMLEALDVHPGHRVLELGTGTGWNAALLAEVVGADNVTTVEIDAGVAGQARAALARAGHDTVTVVTGEGLLGCPERGPYDRVIATMSVYRIPYTWVEQTAQGGRLVVPLANRYQPPGFAVLTRTGDGAAGHLGGPASFMGARGQRHRRPRVSESDDYEPVSSATTVHPARWVSNYDAAIAVGQRVPGVAFDWVPAQEQGRGTLWLLAPEDQSWAAVDVEGGPPHEVTQAGPRKLVDEVLAGYRWWVKRGRPTAREWTVTVDHTGRQQIHTPAAPST